MSDFKNKLELWLVEKFKETDPNARKTPGSGCGNSVGDIQTERFYVEAKMKHTHENIIIEFKKEWQDLLGKMPVNTTKVPVIFTENKYGQKFATLNAEDFFELLRHDERTIWIKNTK
jgi:hypothetical protein